jgi:hypothetical protein
VNADIFENIVLFLCKIETCTLDIFDRRWQREDQGRTFLLSPFVEVPLLLRVCEHWVLARAVNTSDLGIKMDVLLAEGFFGPLNPDFVEISIVNIVLADESSEKIGREILQDVKLITC